MKRLIFLVFLVACTNQNDQGAAPTSSATPPAVATSAATNAVPTSTERPLAAESNPPGDIPDSQAFVTYVSASGGYQIEAPEGWARKVHASNVSFVDKFDGMSVTLSAAAAGSHASDQNQATVASIESHARAGRDFHISSASLPGGSAVMVTFTSNSEPDPVTGKRVRLENQASVFERGRATATVLLWAPLGADNADQWKRIGSSFRWR